MPLPVIADTLRVAVRGTTAQGTPWVNVLHVTKTPASTFGAAIVALHAEVTKLYSAAGYGVTLNGWANWASTAAQALDAVYTPLDGITASDIRALNIAGADVNQQLPSEVAACITHRSTLRGRSHRGRTYLAGVTRTHITSAGQWASGLGSITTEMPGCFNSFNAAVAAHPDLDAFVIASYLAGGSVTPVLASTMDTTPDTQRRRRS